MKRTYIRPEYNTDCQLNDVILASIQYDEENQQIDVNLDIEDLF